MNSLKPWPFYPLLIAAYPLLFLFSANVGKMSFDELALPYAIVLGVTVIVWVTYRWLLKDWQRAALALTPIMIYLFSYTPLIRFFDRHKWKLFGCKRFNLYIIGLGLILLAVYFLVKRLKNAAPITRFLNVSCALLVGFQLVQITKRTLDYDALIASKPSLPQVEIDPQKVRDKPDIYYIILDAYGREDILRDMFGADTSPLINSLKSAGFYVADRAHSNYCQTFLSLGSSLNISHLGSLRLNRGSRIDVAKRVEVRELVTKNRVVRTLKNLGYKIVSFSSGYAGTDMHSADLLIKSKFEISEFQNMLLSLSPVPDLLKKIVRGGSNERQFQAHRDRIQFIFNELPKATSITGPKFVFAHIMSPHPPFLFHRDGTPNDPPTPFSFRDGSHHSLIRQKGYYEAGYGEQVEYISKLLEKAVLDIVRDNPKAVIIVQGDHGPGSHLNWENPTKSNVKERLSILNAYYVPEDLKQQLYPTITPVNSFRLVFNYYFQTDIKPLPDVSYFSTWNTPYQFIDVSERLKD